MIPLGQKKQGKRTCGCFACKRAKGITDPSRADDRGNMRFPPDGRYLLSGDAGQGRKVE